MNQLINDFIEQAGREELLSGIKAVYFDTDDLNDDGLEAWIATRFESNYHAGQFELFIDHTMSDIEIKELA